MRVAFCGGGTGGHVYPALTVAGALREAMAGRALDLLYIGVRGKIDAELVARENVPFAAVTAGPLRGRSLAGTVVGFLRLARGTAEALLLLRRFHPDVIFATGGYGSVGVGLAARILRLPLLVFLPDVEAGLAVKLLARLAARIAVAAPPAAALFPASKTLLTGYPVRSAFFEAKRDASRTRFALDSSLPVLLVSGGSTGASTINEAVAAHLDSYLKVAQIVHVTGRSDFDRLPRVRDALPADLQSRYHLHAYLHDDAIAAAVAAADLAVMRAGASTLGELPAAALPAVLIPGDFSDQSRNARYLEAEGAAVMLPEARLTDLPATVTSLLADTPRLTAMRTSLQRLARPDAAKRLASLLVDMAGGRPAVAA